MVEYMKVVAIFKKNSDKTVDKVLLTITNFLTHILKILGNLEDFYPHRERKILLVIRARALEMYIPLWILILALVVFKVGAQRMRRARRKYRLSNGVEYEIFEEDGSEDTGNQFWTESQNLTTWYRGFDLCMLSNRTNNTVESIMKHCEIEAKARGEELLPMRCRAGNSWPSKGEFCSSEDIPFAHRKNLQRAIIGYDDPSSQPLRDFFPRTRE